MLAYTAIALLAVLSEAVSGSPIEKRYSNSMIRSGRNGQCLTLAPGVVPANGAQLVTRDCTNSVSRWDINPGSGSVILSGTNFALDAGVPQGNNMPAKIWQSYPGSTQQTWYLTDDNRIAVAGGNQCLDEGDNGPQTYQCTSGNTNQVWMVGSAPPPPSSSVSSSASASASASSSSAPPPTATGRQLKFAGDRNLCATVQGGRGGDGVLVNMGQCDSGSSAQRFTFIGNGLIQFANSNYCLDAGSNPANGVQMKLWTCYNGLGPQTFAYPQATGLFRTANNQCLNVDNSNFFKLQTWTCSESDPQQQFLMFSA